MYCPVWSVKVELRPITSFSSLEILLKCFYINIFISLLTISFLVFSGILISQNSYFLSFSFLYIWNAFPLMYTWSDPTIRVLAQMSSERPCTIAIQKSTSHLVKFAILICFTFLFGIYHDLTLWGISRCVSQQVCVHYYLSSPIRMQSPRGLEFLLPTAWNLVGEQ